MRLSFYPILQYFDGIGELVKIVDQPDDDNLRGPQEPDGDVGDGAEPADKRYEDILK